MPSVGPDYDDMIVDKPWGHEYLMFANAQVALWFLFLRRGACTSFHCHPRKKTGLIVLSGTATVRFLNNSSVLRSPANIMMRAGLFHQTVAHEESDVTLIELESPVDKTDLVRLEDKYGRAKTAYEGIEKTRPLDASCLRLPQPDFGDVPTWTLQGRKLRMCRWHDKDSFCQDVRPRDIVLVLEGGLFTDDDRPILTAGDAVSGSTVQRLVPEFETPHGVAALLVLGPDRE